ncbi:chromosome partitioning protein parB [Legionella beliardensis]|uniref:Probable chromosome-partitioning protein ParB n=1 Tax=Legionella beliardensis TaxID=91822 RepID=A0A378I4P3_9GAMM|nr:ParB/RepB/Spo0J family partition protein [Legionella beliardensis]STX30158.1 chromosome partitioning protein parB [Legionella beliardensis]
MSIKRGGLGRNLSALLSTSVPKLISNTSINEITKLAVNYLQPGKYQPRSAIDDLTLHELASSIKQQGLLQPILARALDSGKYEIIAGERRWRACQLAGLTEVPVIIKQVDDETAIAMALVENLQREDLSPLDQARAMARLIEEFDLTHQQIADLLSKSRTAISNFLRLLALSPEVMKLLDNGDLDMGHARALLVLDEEKQVQVATIIIAKNLSVRETEQLVNRLKETKLPEPNSRESLPQFSLIYSHLEKLKEHLNAQVNVKHSKAGKGSLVIHYNSLQELETVIEQIIN